MVFFKKKVFSKKLFYFSIFGSKLKWVEKQSPNLFLSCCEIDSFSKKI